MKRVLFIQLVICGLTLAQDVLIETNGNKVNGKLLSYNYNEDINFVSMVDGEETILIYDWINVQQIQLSNGRIIDSPYFFSSSSNNHFYINQNLRPSWNFHEPKDPFKAGLLSTIILGGGQFYNEQYSKGLISLLGVPLLYAAGLNTIADSDIDDADFLMGSAMVLYLYSIYDAIISSNNINKEYYDLYLIEKIYQRRDSSIKTHNNLPLTD